MQKNSIVASAIYILMLTTIPSLLYSQVLVGGGTPDASALLELQSGTGGGAVGGLLLPRLTTAQRNAINAPAAGLMLYNTSTSCLEVNVGTPANPEWGRMNCLLPAVTSLNCSNATVTGTLKSGQAASGVTASVPYTGSNGGFLNSQAVASTGVTGLTASLNAGNLVSGNGTLVYSITGTPANGGTASFALNVGDQVCTLNICVNYVCSAKINTTDTKEFLCYNLGAANTCADPFTPSWEINGGYWQWGRLVSAAPGPSGPGPDQANDGTVSGWSSVTASSGAWADGPKTDNDPCPAGYRVPTKAQWDGVVANNTITNVGSFTNSATNYGAGVKFGDQLMLPAAGYRSSISGTLLNRGIHGRYWSSTEVGNNFAWYLFFSSSVANTLNNNRTGGPSVRCIAQ
ncbi:MAG: hypothetical protein ACK5FV_11625 [Bacteroidota bacterium]|nr:fibrobacter succinogenes major paralogous domain-containing protein [Saprospiraceae bacterium]